MSSNRRSAPLSLIDHFEAPQGYVGHFGWLCGFSADATFLDLAAERFTGFTAPRRAYGGKISLALLLDPGHRQIAPVEVPGVIHLGSLIDKPKPFALLHAKVGLLGYRHAEKSDQWMLRLLVSTGNWTVHTLERTLDLVWRADLESTDAASPEVERVRSDILAAWDMFKWLFAYFDTRILNAQALAGRVCETERAAALFGTWVRKVAEDRTGQAVQSRYLDNRKRSLLDQLPSRIRQEGGAVSRGGLAMGSGFFQAHADHSAPPSVLQAIVSLLRKEGLLTKSAKVDVFANPEACQGVADAAQAMLRAGWTLRRPGVHACFGNAQRLLHAKFLFSANQRSNTCRSAWLYLGSGNLTKAGFASAVHPQQGNLEAGVLIAPKGLLWREDSSDPDGTPVEDLLPVQWDEESALVQSDLTAGADMSPHDGEFVAPPISWLRWFREKGRGMLEDSGDARGPYEVLTPSGAVCEAAKKDRRVFWPEEHPPRQVRVRWLAGGRSLESEVPVLDDYGRVAATELPRLDLDQAWWSLYEFPAPPQDDGPGDDISDEGGCFREGRDDRSSLPESAYPIRRMMQFIEAVADKQTRLSEVDWPSWCSRLEQVLCLASGSQELQYFLLLGLNPLHPLRHCAFRPPFAENSDGTPGSLYDAALTRVENAWGMAGLPGLGDLS